MGTRGNATVLLLLLLRWSSLGWGGLVVLRSTGGDLFQNLGSSEAYCAQRNAMCSLVTISSTEDGCGVSEGSGDPACPSCGCKPSERYTEDLGICEPSGVCPEYAGTDLFIGRNQIPGMEQSLLVNATFGCQATVRAWRYVLRTPTPDVHFYFQVWRLSGLHASLVASTRINVTAVDTEGDEEVITYLEEGDEIEVEAGDFLGVFIHNGLGSLPIATKRFNVENRKASEAYNFQINSGTQPMLLNLLDYYAYESNAGGNFQAVTGFVSGEIQCLSVPPALPEMTSTVIVISTSLQSPTPSVLLTEDDSTVGQSSKSKSKVNVVMTSLIVVCSTTLVVVSAILATVCLIWTRRAKKRKIKTHKRRANEEYPMTNRSSSATMSNGAIDQDGGSTTTNPSDPVYHVLTPDAGIQRAESTNSITTTVSIHIHYDHEAQNHRSASSRKSKQLFHIVVPTKDERIQHEQEMYFKGGPKSDEECIIAQHQRMCPVQYFEESGVYWEPAQNEDDLYTQFASRNYREILRRYIDMKCDVTLGRGHFGSVQKGTWHTKDGPVDVAVKTLKARYSAEDKLKFLQEAAIMGQFSHPNIVTIHGVVTVGEPIMIVLELMHSGDLRKHLLALRDSLGQPVSQEFPKNFLTFNRHIAAGMHYLSTKGFVHRDLAARNILLNEYLVCKIGDFGMARDILEEDYYYTHGGPIPVKWSAPEALTLRKYTSASDVWSYGVVLFEIWSVGGKPFANISNAEVIARVNEGHRLSPPPGCPQEIYKLMIACWHPDPTQRPTCSQIVDLLSEEDSSLLIWQEGWDTDKIPLTQTESLNSNLTQYTTLQTPLTVGAT